MPFAAVSRSRVQFPAPRHKHPIYYVFPKCQVGLKFRKRCVKPIFMAARPPLRTSRGWDRERAERGKSGVVYDALHLIEAERSIADIFLTFNPSDFERLAVGTTPRILVPPDPPSSRLPR